MYSKWPPSWWKVIGLWLKNHWKATFSDVSCVALQLSTMLSPTVTSALLGLSSTRMASGSTKLLHCHLRLTQTYRHNAEFDWKGNYQNPKQILTVWQKKAPHLCQIGFAINCAQSIYETKVCCVCPCEYDSWMWALASWVSKHNKFPSTRAKVGEKWHWGLFPGGHLVLIWQKIKPPQGITYLLPTVQQSSLLSPTGSLPGTHNFPHPHGWS